MMKNLKYIFMTALAGFVFSSCNDDHEPDWTETTPFEIKVESVSIEDGAVLKSGANALQVIYSADVALNSRAEITLSDNPVESAVVKGDTLDVKFTLALGKEYVLMIPANAVAGVGSKTFAPQIRINFSTEGAPVINVDYSMASSSLTNPNATAEAKQVYNVLRENYGKKQISGVMGGVAWNTDYSDLIEKATGKYPAIVGFDYIHLASSPANWIDYGDITPVKNVWEAGSLPAMTWHWNVPLSEDDPNAGFDAKNNNFKASNVLVDGTWENKVAVADVEKLAGYLKLLQDANIPVLWRPFHEAAGDYTWGPWFWWGNSGVETTIQLWKWLRDKLENEYKLNNLIWVWTIQSSDAGNLAEVAKMQEAYPGNDVVDIVGADIYNDNSLANETARFKALYQTVEGEKIVALSECGNLLDVETAFSDKALWSYFMVWYETDDKGNFGIGNAGWNTKNEWKTVLDNPLVINRGDVRF